MFIELTRLNGEKIFINHNYIQRIEPGTDDKTKDYSMVILKDQLFVVKRKAKDLVEDINLMMIQLSLGPFNDEDIPEDQKED